MTKTLDELDQDEWWDVGRKINPDLTREEFEEQWHEFQWRKLQRRRRAIKKAAA